MSALDTDDFLVEKKPKRGFRRRVFFYILTLSLVTSAVSGTVYYSRQVKFIERDRARRAHTLLTSLATQAELGAYAQDPALCDLPARRTSREEDVVLVGIYNTQGKEILRISSPEIVNPSMPALTALTSLLHDPDAPPLRIAADGYDDLWTPIVTSVRPAAAALSSEPGGTGRREVVGLARVGLSLTPAREQLQEVLFAGVWLTFGLLVLGALAALLIASYISDPILALARSADQIRAGNLDVTISVKAKDEVGQLADSFNRMTIELRETMAKLAALNHNLEAEVLRRTEEIRSAAEFNAILNAPISNTDEEQEGAAEKILGAALESLLAGSGVRGAAVLLPVDDVDFKLQVAAARGADPKAFGTMPSRTLIAAGKPVQEWDRAMVPVLFRGEPEGALILIDERVPDTAVEFAARAAGPLGIAISNARAFGTLRHMTEELTERNTALVAQRDQLQQMNKLKSEFLANVSHELRTPLNAILGYAELIAEGVYGQIGDEQKEALDGILESGRNLLALINTILDLAKVESGKIEVNVGDVGVHDVVQAVVTEAAALAKDRPYVPSASCPARVVIATDGTKLKQILTNLVSNAIKFTEQGSVTVEVKPTISGGCTIYVRDTGVGIRPEHQSLIFEEFRQVDGSSTRKFQGTGLGLAIAKRFSQLLGGTLEVDSRYGSGSTFILVLPPDARTPLANAGVKKTRTVPPTLSPFRETKSNPAMPQVPSGSPLLPTAPPPSSPHNQVATAVVPPPKPLPPNSPASPAPSTKPAAATQPAQPPLSERSK